MVKLRKEKKGIRHRTEGRLPKPQENGRKEEEMKEETQQSQIKN